MELSFLYHPAAKYIVIFLCGFFISLLLTPYCSRLALHFKMIDYPGGRHIHALPTPRGVGISIFLSFHICCLFIFSFDTYFSTAYSTQTLTDISWWISLFLSTLFLSMVGMYDDRYALKPNRKLLAQIVAATILFAGGTQFEGALGLHFPFLLNLVATILWFILIINAFNLIDGYDGLASGVATIAALGIAGTLLYRHLIIETLLLAGFIGACLGFLRYNTHPARAFLGDTGSMFLGIVLAAITLKTTSKGTALAALWIPLLALGVPLFDTFLAIWRRLARKILSYLKHSGHIPGVMSYDTEHIHHRLLSLGLTPRNITAILYLVNCTLVILGLALLFVKDTSLATFFGIFLIGSFLCVRFFARRELRDSGRVIVAAFRSPDTLVLASTLYFCVDVLIVVFIYIFMTQYISTLFFAPHAFFSPFLDWRHLLFLCIFIVFHVPYRMIFTRKLPSASSEWLMLLLSWIMLLFSILLIRKESPYLISILQMMSFGAVVFCMTLLRILPRLVEDILKEKGYLEELDT